MVLIMNCLCNIFDDGNIWILILVLAILYLHCNGCGGRGCGMPAVNSGCNGGCGCS